jgi:hypothetical protein
VISYLRIIVNPRDELAWKRILKLIPGIGNVTANRVYESLSGSESMEISRIVGGPRDSEPTRFLAVLAKLKSSTTSSKGAKHGLTELVKMLEILVSAEFRDRPAKQIAFIHENGYEQYLLENFENAEARGEDIRGLAHFAQRYETTEAFLSELALLATEVRAARTIPTEYGIGGLTAYGELLGDYSYDWMQRELVRPFYFKDNERLPQYATEAVLRHRVRELATVETLHGWVADDVSQDEGGVAVRVTARGGASRQTLRGKYVVGCDGSRSTVREQCGITQTLSDHDKLMVLLVFRSEELHQLLQRYPGKS